MADIKYKLDWVPDTKRLSEKATEGTPRKGIASRPSTDKPEQADYYTKMYRLMSSYFDSDAEADKVLSSKKPNSDAIKSMTMQEYAEAVKASAYEVSQAREMAGITRSLTEGGGEIGRKPLPEGTTLRPVARPSATTLRDVTDTDEGMLDNEQPLRDLAEATSTKLIKATELEPVAQEETDEGDPVVDALVEQLTTTRLSAGKDDQESAPVTAEEETTEPTTGGLMSKGPSKRAKLVTEPRKTDEFYLNIGEKAETDHGSTPQVTNDAREDNLPDAQKSRDIGFGHKITSAENTSGKIHGVKFKKEDGTFISLSDKDKRTILKADMKLHQDAARKSGWDAKLKNIGTSWDKLEAPYQNALTSLAYNVGGDKAGKTWTNVLTAAKNKDVGAFALGLRRKDAGKNTAGMDNRVAKELYYAGLISNLSEVSDQLPLANATQAGIPE